MTNEIVALVQKQVQTQVNVVVRRVAVPAAFAAVAGLFALFALAGLFMALFFWLAPERGPLEASLIVTLVALALALLAVLPIVFRRKPAPPPVQQDSMLPQFVSLLARTTPGLSPKSLIISAALVAAMLFFGSRSNKA